jgi:hypothetical protein
MSRLTDHEITRLVNRCIGVSGGYLGLPERFSYRIRSDFYSEYCDLEVSFEGHDSTTARPARRSCPSWRPVPERSGEELLGRH